jgi:hypothetical protein
MIEALSKYGFTDNIEKCLLLYNICLDQLFIAVVLTHYFHNQKRP